jgi:SSS family transporter
VLAPAYWLGNQAIIQRTLGAQSEWDAKAGTLFAGLLHALIPIMIAVPGLVGLALYYGEIDNPDLAFPHLVHRLLPAGLTGVIFAVFLAALMSTVSAVVDSAATLWTRDIYKQFIAPHQSDRHYLTLGRFLTFFFVVCGVATAPVVNYFESIYQAIQNFLTFIQGPNLALLVFGVLWKRTTGKGALAGLFTGLATSIGLFTLHRMYHIFRQDDPFLYIAWWSFFCSSVATVGVSLLTKPPPPEKIRGLVFRLALEDREVQDALKKRIEG